MKRAPALAIVALALAAGSVSAGAPQPVIERAQGGTCVAAPERMRRDHMEMLKHQRDETVRGGIRGAAGSNAASLKACVECHAGAKTGSVASAPGDFCVSCHSYAAVKIDCFECHAARPKAAAQVKAAQ